MKADHGLSPALSLGRCLCALALAAVSLNTWAAKAGDFGKNLIVQNGKSTTIMPMGATVNSGGSTIPVTPTVGGWTGAGNYGFPPQATGPTAGVVYKGQFVDGGSGAAQVAKGYPYQATSTVPWTGVAAAIAGLSCGLLSGGAAALACSLGVPLVMDWITKGGGRLNPQTGALERTDPLICTTAPCFNYFITVDSPPQGLFAGVYDASVACNKWAQWRSTNFPNDPNRVEVVSFTTNTCTVRFVNKTTGVVGSNYTASIQRTSATPATPTWIPASMSDIAPYMGTPANGRVIGEILDKGGSIELSNPTITGPTAIKGPESTTINPDGSRTVQSTTNNYTTNGNTVTNTSNVTTTTTYNTDNSVRSVSHTTEVPTEESEKEDLCKQFPERLGCVELDTPEGKIPKSTKEVSYTAESVWGGGSCPQDKQWSSQTMGRSYTLIPWSTACGWAVSMRAVVLLLAAWAAFWIVMPGNTQVKPQ